MNKKRDENNGEVLVNKEYIKNCLAISPEARLRELESLNKFIFEAMPEKSKRSWEKLKKADY